MSRATVGMLCQKIDRLTDRVEAIEKRSSSARIEKSLARSIVDPTVLVTFGGTKKRWTSLEARAALLQIIGELDKVKGPHNPRHEQWEDCDDPGFCWCGRAQLYRDMLKGKP